MKIVYIASPYTLGDVAVNVKVQQQAAHDLLDRGLVPIVPLLCHYLHIYRARPYEDWINMCLALVPKADIMLRLPGESSGADREVELALHSGVHVVYSLDELDDYLRFWGIKCLNV